MFFMIWHVSEKVVLNFFGRVYFYASIQCLTEPNLPKAWAMSSIIFWHRNCEALRHPQSQMLKWQISVSRAGRHSELISSRRAGTVGLAGRRLPAPGLDTCITTNSPGGKDLAVRLPRDGFLHLYLLNIYIIYISIYFYIYFLYMYVYMYIYWAYERIQEENEWFKVNWDVAELWNRLISQLSNTPNICLYFARILSPWMELRCLRAGQPVSDFSKIKNWNKAPPPDSDTQTPSALVLSEIYFLDCLDATEVTQPMLEASSQHR